MFGNVMCLINHIRISTIMYWIQNSSVLITIVINCRFPVINIMNQLYSIDIMYWVQNSSVLFTDVINCRFPVLNISIHLYSIDLFCVINTLYFI